MKKMFGLALLALSSVAFAGPGDDEPKLKPTFINCGAECEEVEEEEVEEENQ